MMHSAADKNDFFVPVRVLRRPQLSDAEALLAVCRNRHETFCEWRLSLPNHTVVIERLIDKYGRMRESQFFMNDRVLTSTNGEMNAWLKDHPFEVIETADFVERSRAYHLVRFCTDSNDVHFKLRFG